MGMNTFAGGTLDRVGERRSDDAWVQARLADPAARAVVTGREGVLVAEGDPPTAALLSPLLDDTPTLLGLQGDTPIFVIGLDEIEHPPGTRVAGLRETSAALPAADAALLAYATALTEWQRRSRFCGVCGAPNRQAEAGHLMVCTARGPSAPSAHRPRDHRARHRRRRPRAHGPSGDLAGEALVVPRRVRRARGVAGGGRRARGRRGGRGRRLGGDLHLQPAVAVPREPHARLPRPLVRAASRPRATPSSRRCAGSAARRSSPRTPRPTSPWTPDQREPPAGIDFWLPPREAIARQLVAAWVEA